MIVLDIVAVLFLAGVVILALVGIVMKLWEERDEVIAFVLCCLALAGAFALLWHAGTVLERVFK